jgi:dihydroxy-acid dehydratase
LNTVGRLNRPGLMVYGGTIRAGSCEGAPQLDVVDAFQSYGKYLQDGKTPQAERERYNTIRHACPGSGACGGVSAVSSSARPNLYLQNLDVHGQYYGKRS